MPYLLLLLLIALAAGIAYYIIGHEQRTQATKPVEPIFDIDKAVPWVADHLPAEHQAILSYDDVRAIIIWNVQFLQARGAIANGHAPQVKGPVVVGGVETVEYVLNQPDAQRRALTSEQVHAVLDAQVAYLGYIGAVGKPAQDTNEEPDEQE